MCCSFILGSNNLPCPLYSREGKKAHVLTPEKIKEVQYNGIRESTMPRDVPRSSALRNDLDVKPSSYRCVNFPKARFRNGNFQFASF